MKTTLLIAVGGALLTLVFPSYAGLISRIAIMALLVLSLDLLVGIAGLASLGHAALFGTGAYAAGLFALHYNADPLLGLVIGAMAGGCIAFLSGAFLLRYEGFTFLMLTVAIASILQSLANKWSVVTGGDDGLSGFIMKPIFGHFTFDLAGKTAAYYAIIVLALCYYAMHRLIQSPFGLAIKGIHENRALMSSLGTPIFKRLLMVYTIAGVFAGLAGALSAQTNAIVALDALGFSLSAETLVMLILGGTGKLWGAVIGAIGFTLLHHTASSINPYHWLFVIGMTLMVVVFMRGRK